MPAWILQWQLTTVSHWATAPGQLRQGLQKSSLRFFWSWLYRTFVSIASNLCRKPSFRTFFSIFKNDNFFIEVRFRSKRDFDWNWKPGHLELHSSLINGFFILAITFFFALSLNHVRTHTQVQKHPHTHSRTYAHLCWLDSLTHSYMCINKHSYRNIHRGTDFRIHATTYTNSYTLYHLHGRHLQSSSEYSFPAKQVPECIFCWWRSGQKGWGRLELWEKMCVFMSECVCVCNWDRESERQCVCVCVCVFNDLTFL